ncbi:hypothetical protein, partial [Ruminococcus bicirculans (ex Wegman et al. 2014)]|uniref:hypothetical protein n=1 Tax=Ruminococcus bicirculans (ex Wegman et al. 2014) TaxID=1160721 RepID=UPI00241F1ED2
IIFLWLVIHDTLIIPQKKTAVLLFGKIAAFFLGNFFLQPLLLCGAYKKRVTLFGSTKHNHTCLGNTKTPPAALSSYNKKSMTDNARHGE